MGTEQGVYYLAMEFIHGKSLVPIFSGSALPLDVAMSIALQATAGLAYAHRATDEQARPLNIVHRDVSPKNILVSYQGDVKLVDFGIARAADQSHVTMTGEIKGTLNYMPLEQVNGTAVDARSDIYAMGASLFELFTNRRLFQFETLPRIAAFKANTRVVPRLDKIREDLPEGLDQIIRRCLADNPDGRPADGNELLEQLHDLAHDLAIKVGANCVASWMANEYPEECSQPLVKKAELTLAQMLASEDTSNPSADTNGDSFAAIFGSENQPNDAGQPSGNTIDTAAIVYGAEGRSNVNGVGDTFLAASPITELDGAPRRSRAPYFYLLGGATLLALIIFFVMPTGSGNGPAQHDGTLPADVGSLATRNEIDAAQTKDLAKKDTAIKADSGLSATAPIADAGRQPDKLTPATAEVAVVEVRLKSKPKGSAVYLKGRYQGKTPLVLRRKQGSQPLRVSLKRKGYLAAHRTIDFRRSRSFVITLKQIKKEPVKPKDTGLKWN